MFSSFHQPLNFLTQKIRQIKAGENKKYDITNTSGLVQVWTGWQPEKKIIFKLCTILIP